MRRYQWTVRRSVVSGSVVAVLVATVGLANGAALKQKSVEFTVGNDEVEQRVAKCKRGQTAVAGGFFDSIGPMSDVVPLDSKREGNRKWRHRAANFEGPDTATAYVYCDPHGRKLTRRSATVTVDPDEDATLFARCGRNKEAVSGGFDFPDDGSRFLVASKRADERRWQVTVLNTSPNPGTYAAFAYCDKSEPGLKTRTKTLTISGTGPESVVARCERGEKLLSGGVEAGASQMFADGGARGSRRVGKRGWEATGASVFLDEPEVTAYAYCDKKEKK